jgi:tetratricopeptide (TPR) repeat protein
VVLPQSYGQTPQLSLDPSIPGVSFDSIDIYIDELVKVAKSKNHDSALFLFTQLLEAPAFSELTIRQKLRINDGAAECMSNLKAYDLGVQYTQRSLKLVQEQKDFMPFEMSWRLGRIGSYLIFAGSYDSAIANFRRSIPWTQKNQDPIYVAAAYNNLGIVFSKLNETDSAFKYYRMAEETFTLKTEKDSTFVLSVNDNLAELYASLGNENQAHELHNWNFEVAKELKSGNTKRVLYHGIQLAKSFQTIGDFKDILSLTEKLDSIAIERNDLESRVKIAQIRKEHFKEKERYSQSLFYADLELELSAQLREEFEKSTQSVNRKLSQLRIDKVLGDLELEKLNRQSKEDQLEISRQKTNMNRLWIVGILIIGILSIVFLVQNHKKQIRQKKLEREKLDVELELKKKDLEDFAMDLSRKQEWTQEISGRLGEIKKLEVDEYARAIQKLLIEIRNEQALEKRKKVFQSNVEEVNHQFYERLNERYPKLTKTEKELAGLLRIGLSNKEIADLRNTEVSSMKKGRNRLRKKLELDPDIDIYEFLKRI